MKPLAPSREPAEFYIQVWEQTLSFSLDCFDGRDLGK